MCMNRIKKIDLCNLTEEEKQLFTSIIGGIDVSSEKKKESLNKIKNAIHFNRIGRPTDLDLECFAYGYPESINLFKEYFRSYEGAWYGSTIALIKEFEGHTVQGAFSLKKQQISIMKRITLLTFIPELINEDNSICDYMDLLGITPYELISTLRYYRSGFVDAPKNASELSVYCNDDMIRIIEDSVFNKRIRGKRFCKKYSVDDKVYTNCVNASVHCADIINEFQNIEDDEYDYMLELFEIISEYAVNGIEIDGVKVKFTLLDYCNFTDKSFREFISFCREIRNSPENKKKFQDICAFFGRAKSLYTEDIVEKKSYLDRKTKYIINGEETLIDEEAVDYIFKSFDEHSVPKYNILLNIASRRYAMKLPIFPFGLKSLKKDNPEKVLVKE